MTASVSFSIVIGGTSVSPDGASITAPSPSTLHITDGTFVFGATQDHTMGYPVLLNGTDTQARGAVMQVEHGSLYLKDLANSWYLFSAPDTWTPVSAPPTLTRVWNPPLPGGATFNDTTPVGTVVAKVQGVWSDGAPYTRSSQFLDDGSGAPPSGVSVVPGATNYALGAVVPASDTNAITSTGIYALVLCPDHSGALIINPHGPGVSGAGGTTENVDVELF